MVKPSPPSLTQKRGISSSRSSSSINIRYVFSWLVIGIVFLFLASIWMIQDHINSTNNHYEQSQTETNTRRIPTRRKSSSSLSSSTFLDGHPHFPHEPFPRPTLNSMIQGWNITNDVSWLLNLAIIGFPKTGTSTLMQYLHKSSQIYIFDEERCEIGYNQHVKLIESLYNDIPEGDIIRGIKCPRDLESSLSLTNYQKYFVKTNFMIGLRHPVDWFESFYNFR